MSMTNTTLAERLREHADRVAGGGPSEKNYDPETLEIEHDAADIICQLETELNEALKDKARLDWFDDNFNGHGEPNPNATGGTVWHVKFPGVHTRSLREAIDKAMPREATP